MINFIAIVMMSAKLVTPGLLKITDFENKGYAVIIQIYDVNIKISSHDTIYIANAVM